MRRGWQPMSRQWTLLVVLLATISFHGALGQGLSVSQAQPNFSAGLDSVLKSFLDNSLVNQTQTALASNLLGITSVVQTTPAISLQPNFAVVNASQVAGSAQGLLSSLDSALQSVMQKFADLLPGNKTTLTLPGQKESDLKLGTKETGWKGFKLPTIEVGGVQLNPATIDLNTLDQLVSDLKSPFCSEALVNKTAEVPAVLQYSTFTLTLETGACAITTDFTPNPNNPYDDWLASKGFVCKTPQLRFSQDPATFTDSYMAPSTLITSSCKVAKNTTDGWSRTLYSAGDPVTYASRAALMVAMKNGTQTDIFTPSAKSSLMEAIIGPLKQYIDDAAASAPPLVVSVDSTFKSGRRLKGFVEHL